MLKDGLRYLMYDPMSEQNSIWSLVGSGKCKIAAERSLSQLEKLVMVKDSQGKIRLHKCFKKMAAN